MCDGFIEQPVPQVNWSWFSDFSVSNLEPEISVALWFSRFSPQIPVFCKFKEKEKRATFVRKVTIGEVSSE
jgi:hypothetical protein